MQLTDQLRHPRSWDTDLSHQRKLHSYQVETAWYAEWSRYCDVACRVPECTALDNKNDEVLMVFEDLDMTGFPERRTSVNLVELKTCLNWLANFHATFLAPILNYLIKS